MDTKHISFGGGIVTFRDLDLGDVHGFDMNIAIEINHKEKYMGNVSDVDGSVFRVKESTGRISGIEITGNFICESININVINSLLFGGIDSNALPSGDGASETSTFASVVPEVVFYQGALTFTGVPGSGSKISLSVPMATVLMGGDLKLQNHDGWLNIPFKWEALLGAGFPTVTTQVEEKAPAY